MKLHSLALAIAFLSGTAAAQQGAAKPDGLIVHEWGTFTSFSGPSGEVQPFHVVIGEQLPDFVQARVGGSEWVGVHAGAFEKQAILSQQRMETPVLYFYSSKPQEVSVGVSMPDGLITEVYPPVSGATPAKLQMEAIPQSGSSIRWDHVSIAPSYCCDTMTMKTGESHYFQARATKADVVSVKRGEETLSERFLFYRGVARGDNGIKAKPLGSDTFLIDRSEAGPLAAVFAVEVGEHIRFAQANNVKPGDRLTLPKETSTMESLGAAVTKSLIDAGLYVDEAQAMVNTWKHLWFGESGTRLMVILPQTTIDKELPLSITPSPAQVKRVFVARLEVLTPEKLAHVEDLLARSETQPGQREAINAELSLLGRFHEPATKLAREELAKHAQKGGV